MYAIIVLLFGLAFGSFGNSVVHRLPRRMLADWRREAQEFLELPTDELTDPTLSATRSHCPHCKAQIAWYDNLPVISWLLLAGKCRNCKARISLRYLLLELAGGGLALGAYAMFGLSPAAAVAAGAGLLLLWASAIDVEHMLLPDVLVFPLLWAGLFAATQSLFIAPADAILGGMLGFVILYVPAEAYRLLRGHEGLGFGDAKLLMALGTFVGPKLIPVGIVIACAIAIVAHLLIRLVKDPEAARRLPFGQWIALGMTVVFVLAQTHQLMF